MALNLYSCCCWTYLRVCNITATASTLRLIESYHLPHPVSLPILITSYYIDSENDSKGKTPLANYYGVEFIQHFKFPWRLLTQTLTLNQTNLSCFNILFFFFFLKRVYKRKARPVAVRLLGNLTFLTKVIYKLCKWNIYLCEEFCGFFWKVGLELLLFGKWLRNLWMLSCINFTAAVTLQNNFAFVEGVCTF